MNGLFGEGGARAALAFALVAVACGVVSMAGGAASALAMPPGNTATPLETTTTTSETVAYRVNAGGPALAGGWSGDTSSSPSPYVNASSTSTSSTTATIDMSHASIPTGTPMAMFQTERWDGTTAPEMQWNFPVTSGATYKVRLYFAETYSGAMKVGGRRIDVFVEGALVLNDYDVYADVGAGNKGVMKEFGVTTDSNLDIDFGHVTQNPAVKGIEIIQTADAPPPPPPASASTSRVSVTATGAQANGASDVAVLNTDGRYVVFQSDASNLVAGDTNAKTDIFRKDRSTGEVVRVSVADNESEANGISTDPTVSANGQFVAFQSAASNLVTGDANGFTDIFVRDVLAGTTRRVSVSSSGVEGNSTSDQPMISDDGRYVVFRSFATKLTGGDTNGYTDIFLHELATKTTIRVSLNGNGLEGQFESTHPGISSDGRYVVFRSKSNGLVPDDNNFAYDIFVKDWQSGSIRRASVTSSGGQVNADAHEPSISSSGRYVTFESVGVYVSGDANAKRDIFFRDMTAGTTSRVSIADDGTEGNGDSTFANVSGDGRFVAFQSVASNLVAGDTNAVADVFLYDRDLRRVRRVSVSTSGAQANANSVRPTINANGRYVGFRGFASNLVSSDTNGVADAFVRDEGEPPIMDLAITKTDAADPVDAGQDIRYTITVENKGNATATRVVVTDPVDAGMTYVSSSASQGTCSFDGSIVTCSIGTVAPAEKPTVTVVMRRANPGTATNTATVSLYERDHVPANNSESETTTVNGTGQPDLAITKADAADPVPLNVNITYTITVKNNGNADATNVTVSDAVPLNMSYVSGRTSQGSGCALASGVVSCNLGTIIPTTTATATLVFRASAEGTHSNTASVASTEADANAVDNTATETTTVGPPLPSLTLTKSDQGTDPMTLGRNLTYKLTVKENGPATSTGVTVTDTLPADVTFVSATSAKGPCSFSGRNVTCTLGTFAPGTIATVFITVTPTAEKVITNTASVVSDEPDVNPDDNSASETTKVTELSELVDRTWQTNGLVDAIVYSPDGNTVYLAGSFTSVRPAGSPTGSNEVARSNAAAFDARTGDLLPWNPAPNGEVNSMDIKANGTLIYLAGKFSTVGGQSRANVAAVDAVNGTPTSWNPTPWARVYAIELSADESKVYIGGPFNTVNGVSRSKLAALYTANRNVVPEFAPVVSYPDKPTAANVRSLALSPDGGGLYVGGTFMQVDGQPHVSMAKIDLGTGTAIASWDAKIERKTNKFEVQVYDIAVLGSEVFVCGDFYKVAGYVLPNMASVNASTGAVRVPFPATDGAVNACEVSDNRLYIGGHFEKMYPDGETRKHIASVNLVTGKLTIWDPGADSIEGVYAFATTPTRLAAGGTFGHIGHGRAQSGFAQFSGNP